MRKTAITPKQEEVLNYLACGLPNKQIAHAMGVSIATVKLHLLGLYQRLDVNSRICALIKAQQLGLVRVQKNESGRRESDGADNSGTP